MLRWWCSGVVWWDVDVHVHVTSILFRRRVGWDVDVHVHVTLIMLRWWCYVDVQGWRGMGSDVTLMMLRQVGYVALMMLCWWFVFLDVCCCVRYNIFMRRLWNRLTFEWFDWSKGYGHGCGAEQAWEETIHISWLPWANNFSLHC